MNPEEEIIEQRSEQKSEPNDIDNNAGKEIVIGILGGVAIALAIAAIKRIP